MRLPALLLALCLMALPAWGASPSNLTPKPVVKPPAAPMPVKPAPAVKPAKLSTQDKADIARIETYLNELKSVGANFTQVNDMGEFRHGKIAIQRPGKMRVTYDPPQKDFIVADGEYVHIWDDGMQQQTNMPVGSSIAELILRDPIKLSGDVTITRFERFPLKLELTVVSTQDPGDGQLTLIFEDKPLQLRQWRVLDAQGRTTGVNLENAREGVTFASNTFDFIPPNFGKRQ
jgi:outer membrane lipoprotein-sorting protein